MKITDYSFSGDEIKRLHQYKDNQKDSRLQMRFIVIILLASPIDISLICSIASKSLKTIENWFHQYITQGIDSLNSFNYKPKQTFLNDEQIKQLIGWVKNTNPSKAKEVRQYIKEQFNVSYDVESVRQLLKKKRA